MLETCITSLFFSAILPLRWPRINKMVLMLILVICCVVPGYYKLVYSLDTHSVIYHIVNTIQTVVFILYICIFYKCNIWIKVLAFMFMMIANVLSAAISQYIANIRGLKCDYGIGNIETVQIYSGVLPPLALIYIFIAMIWNKTLHSKYKINNLWLFTIFPVAQFIITFGTVNDYYSDIDIWAGISLLTGVIADMVLLFILMNQSEKEHLEKQMKEREQILAIEAVHYEELEAKRTELAKFRHDYNNQLTTAILLEEQGNREMAGKMIKELRERVMG